MSIILLLEVKMELFTQLVGMWSIVKKKEILFQLLQKCVSLLGHLLVSNNNILDTDQELVCLIHLKAMERLSQVFLHITDKEL